MSLKPFRDTKIRITIARCKKLACVLTGRHRNHTTLWSIFLGQTKFNRDNPSVNNILRAREMSLKPLWDRKIRITIARCKKRARVPIGRNRDHTTLWSIFLGQTEFNRDNPGVSNIIRVREMSLKPFMDTKTRITIVRYKKRARVPTGRNRDHTTLWSIFLCQTEFNRDNPDVSNILRAIKMSLKPFRNTKIWITIVRCKRRMWVPTRRNRDHTTLWSIFLGETEFNWDNPGVSNILRAREMSLKLFRDIKIRITIVRFKRRAWVSTGRNRDHTTLWSIFLGQTEYNQDNSGVSNILRTRKMILKAFRDTKIWITIFWCKRRAWVPTGRNRDHTTLSSIFLRKTNLIKTTPVFLIF
jgi:hypothetical protein